MGGIKINGNKRKAFRSLGKQGLFWKLWEKNMRTSTVKDAPYLECFLNATVGSPRTLTTGTLTDLQMGSTGILQVGHVNLHPDSTLMGPLRTRRKFGQGTAKGLPGS